jgi:diguanylate cyclase (GGDEF)-like protein
MDAPETHHEGLIGGARIKPRRRANGSLGNELNSEGDAESKPESRPPLQADEPLSIVVVEDDSTDAMILQRALSRCVQPISMRVATTFKAFCDLVHAEMPHIVLMDLGLGDCNGLEAVQTAVRLFPDLPIIVLTGLDHEPTARKAIDFGAQDYLLKPQNDGDQLRSRLVFALQRHYLKRIDRELIENLEVAASIDPLTGLLNRSSLYAETYRQHRIALRSGSPLSIGVIDLDYFKVVNDTHGHHVGDEVLNGFAERLTRLFRASDIFGRIGGEEFCCVLPSTDREQASIWGLRTCEAIRAAPFETSAGQIDLTCSIGVATLNDSIKDISDLLGLADEASRIAKRSGRDRVISDLSSTQEAGKQTALAVTQSVFSSMDQLTAGELMLPLVATISAERTARDAARVMLDLRVDAVAVLDASGKLQSLLAEEEIVSHLLRDGRWDENVATMASRSVVFPEKASIGKVWEFFQRVPVRRLVIENSMREPVGIINRGQILRWCFNLAEESHGQLNVQAKIPQASLSAMFSERSQALFESLAAGSGADEISMIASISSLQDLLAQALHMVTSHHSDSNEVKGMSSLV